MLARSILFFLLTISPAVCLSQDELTRVLILGDSTYQQPTREIAKALKEDAEVVFPTIGPGEIRSTHYALKNFEKLIGTNSWDIIHFNFGLGDLVYRAPNMDAFRVLPREAGGVRAVSPEKYQANLQQLVTKLKTTNAKLIWASTTPIRHSSTGVFDKGSEVQYNKIAEQIMKENNISINDMHSYVKNLIDMERPASHGADPFHFDRKPIYRPVLKSIRESLNR